MEGSSSSSSSSVKAGVPVMLAEIEPSSPFWINGQSLRVNGRLAAYDSESGIAEIRDGDAVLHVSTLPQIESLAFTVGSMYQFIGDLQLSSSSSSSSPPLLHARIGRLVDGLDLNIYHQSLLLSRRLLSALPTS